MSRDDAFDILFEIEKSLRYHQRRRAFYDGKHKFLMFLVIILGSASAAAAISPESVGGSSVWLATGIGFATAIAGAVDLVAALSDRARDHEFLYRRFSELMKEIKRKIDPSAEDLTSWRVRRIEIESDEPPIYWGIEAGCYNEVASAFDRNPAEMVEISGWRALLKNYLMFDPTRFPPVGPAKAA